MGFLLIANTSYENRMQEVYHLCDLTTKPQYLKACILFPHVLLIYPTPCTTPAKKMNKIKHLQDPEIHSTFKTYILLYESTDAQFILELNPFHVS